MSDIIDNLRTAQKKAEASGNPKAASFVGHQVSLKPKNNNINNCIDAIFLTDIFLAIYKILIPNYSRTLFLFSVGEGSTGS